MGKKTVEVDEKQLGVLCRLVASLRDCADYFGCSHDTIERRVREWGYEDFASFREQNMVHTRFQLKRDLIERSKKSDTLLIFALKNMCGFADKNESQVEQKNISINVDKQDMEL